MNAQIEQLYGLVLAGGKSSRMGKDKSVIAYHGKPQVEVAFELLSKFCAKVFLSNRRDQMNGDSYEKFLQLHDEIEYEGKGPLAGIVSAMNKYPQAAWVVLACDLPFVDEPTIKCLLGSRDKTKIATAYKSNHDGLPEPLCAVWEAGYFDRVVGLMGQGIYCPRKVLIQSGVLLIDLKDPKALDNVNNPDEFNEAMQRLSGGALIDEIQLID